MRFLSGQMIVPDPILLRALDIVLADVQQPHAESSARSIK